MEANAMPKKALIVDNDFYLTAFIAEELESAGYNVLKAYNGLEALDLLEQHEVDLLVVDLIMPAVNGRQMIRFLRGKSPKIRFPIVALFIVEEGEEIEDVAAEYFVVKGPIDDMAASISSVLDMIDKGLSPSPSIPEVFQEPRLIPRHTIDELLHCVNQTQRVIESLSLGVLVLDRRTRVISSNPAALQLVRRPYVEVLGQQVKYLFSKEDEPAIMEALRRTLPRPDVKVRSDTSFLIHSGKTQASVSLLKTGSTPAGWVLALCPIKASNGSIDQP
jgi:DNA-binding response OmpR family regulator